MDPLKKQQSTPRDASSAVSLQDRYRFIVENAPEILALLGAGAIILYMSPHTEKVLGYRENEVEGRNIFDLIHPEDAPRAAQEYVSAVQQEEGERVPTVLRFRDAAGMWVPFEFMISNLLQHSDIQAIVLTAHDFRFRNEIENAHCANADTGAEVVRRATELAKINAELRIENQARRQAENQLEQAISVLNATLDATADGIIVTTNEGKITSFNKKFSEMWRTPCVLPHGADIESFLAEFGGELEDPNGAIRDARERRFDQSATTFDVAHFKDGRIFEFYSQAQRINNQIIGRVWSFRDVTRARNLELELRQSQKMEALGRLAGGVAHDFNNLLMLIFGYANQLIENPSSEIEHGTCEQILATTRRAAALTKQLLAFSRKQPDAPAVADLNLIVQNLEPMLRRLLSENIKLQVSVASDALPVYVDVSQIEMLIMNLAVNAQDAMLEGGWLSIATIGEALSSGEHGVGEENTKIFAVLEVRDSGHGMTPEIQARIFEPFFTTKTLGRGTGLGLATVRGIVERASGHIKVQSKPNYGTTFRVYLPQAETAPAAPVIAPSISPPSGGNETILLAEDESVIREMTRAYLETLGYHVLEAEDGSQAVRRSLEYGGPIHLVLTDLNMPGLRGDSVVKTIRKYRPTIKAVFMSGYADERVAEDPDGILHKPFELPELGRRLRSVLDVGSADNGQRN